MAKKKVKLTPINKLIEEAELLLGTLQVMKEEAKKRGGEKELRGAALFAGTLSRELLWHIETWQNENCDLTQY